MVNARRNGRRVLVAQASSNRFLRLVQTCGELRNIVAPDLLSKRLLDQLLQLFFRRDSNIVSGTEVVQAMITLHRRSGREYGPSTIKIAALYPPEPDQTVSGSRDCTRTGGGQLCICSHDLPTAVAGGVGLYQTRL